MTERGQKSNDLSMVESVMSLAEWSFNIASCPYVTIATTSCPVTITSHGPCSVTLWRDPVGDQLSYWHWYLGHGYLGGHMCQFS